MKYDCEIPVHDILGRKTGNGQRHTKKISRTFVFFQVTKADSMRKVIQHIDERNWRTLEYFRMLDKHNKLQLNSKTVTLDILVGNLSINYILCLNLVEIRCST